MKKRVKKPSMKNKLLKKKKDDIIVAKIKYSRWKKLKSYTDDPTKISHALGKFFQSGDYGPEMVRLLRIVMIGWFRVDIW